ncbi:MAG: TRAP transporter substrate-binding protein [Thiotrichales bacterium]
MQRRDFLKSAGAGVVAAAGGVSTAQAQAALEVKWRLASSFPKSLDTIFGSSELLARRVSELTDGRFEIRPFAGGELVPGLQVLDACQNGTVECGHTASYYYWGKDWTFCFDCAMPFGLSARQQNAWLYEGGGLDLLREFFKGYGVINFPGGNTGVQMGGWFRKEIKSIADIKGLKMRIAGLGGKVLEALGAVPQQIAGSDIYPALEKGTIDAAEWVGPYDDEKLGFNKVAPYYCFPGFWEGGPTLSFIVNLDAWNKLPRNFQVAFETAAVEANMTMLCKYDAQNPAALSRLLQSGAKLNPFPKDVLEAAFKVAHELYEAETKRNPTFAKVYASWKRFRSAEVQWFRIAEGTYSNFMSAQKL